jgi:hypothetical protein
MSSVHPEFTICYVKIIPSAFLILNLPSLSLLPVLEAFLLDPFTLTFRCGAFQDIALNLLTVILMQIPSNVEKRQFIMACGVDSSNQ